MRIIPAYQAVEAPLKCSVFGGAMVWLSGPREFFLVIEACENAAHEVFIEGVNNAACKA
jgi:hypothetical protein